MTNEEKFTKEIVEVALRGRIAISKTTGEPVRCCGFDCEDCVFGNSDGSCNEQLVEWAKSEYKEPITAESLAREFSKYHGSIRLGYILSFANWVLNRYTLTEKEAENEE